MNAKLFLRSAAVITLLLTVGHMLGSPWTPVHTPTGLAVVTAMKSYRFPAMGFERTYYEFYVGFGWMLGAYAAAHAVIFWQLAGLSSQFPGKLRPLVAVLCLEAVCGRCWNGSFFSGPRSCFRRPPPCASQLHGG